MITNNFSHGMKVTQHGEFGIVIKSELDTPNLCGVIRWDNPRENDIDDWRGQFETFIQLGGEVLNDDHSFQFINDDGSLKTK